MLRLLKLDNFSKYEKEFLNDEQYIPREKLAMRKQKNKNK